MIYNSSSIENIEKIIYHPKVMFWISDDFSEDYEVIIHPKILYLMNTENTGVIRVDPLNGITCSVHIATLPELWGKAKDFVAEAISWGFENTRYQKIIGIIPSFNDRTIGFVQKLGFRQEGILTKSYMRSWKLYDQIIFSFNKGDVLCHK